MSDLSDRILGPSTGKRRRRALLGTLVALAAALIIAVAQATPPEQNPPGYFELDKNVINNEQTPSFGTAPNLKTLGSLGGNISASATSFTVCQNVDTPSPALSFPITIQVEAERIRIASIANAGGGGCSGAFKKTYTVDGGLAGRGVDGTTAASHGASGVQGYVTQVISTATVGDDWDQVKAAVDANNLLDPEDQADNPCSTFTGSNWTGNDDAVACDWIHDPEGETVFTTGGSKDDHDIPDWRYTDSSVPDSDDINDGYAIKYQNAAPGSHQFLYFGADRIAVNGAKDMGFWFFKNEVMPDPDSDGFIDGDGDPAEHAVGDILILSTFTNGGATTTIRVFKWVGPGNGDTNDVLDDFSTGQDFGDCVPGDHNDGCGTVNNGTIKSPWAYQSKISGTPANTIFAGGALEGGVDLTELNLTGCFSTFMAETRAAPEVSATLKDFLIGTFEACGSSLVTTPKDGNGGTIPADGLSIGTGIVNAKDSADLQVTGTDTWEGTFKFFLCGPIPTAETCDGTDNVGLQIGNTVNLDVTPEDPFSGPLVSDAARLTSAANDTTGAPGHYCWRGVFTSGTVGVDSQTDATQGECFFVKPVQPTLVTTAVTALDLLSPKIFGGLADLNGDGSGASDPTPDDGAVFYGDTSIIGGKLDCDDWKNQVPPENAENAGTEGDGVIDGNDDCTLVGVDGTIDGVTIGVVAGSFATIDGAPIPDGTPLPTKFKFPAVTSSTVADADFAWSTQFGRVDANGDGNPSGPTGDDCSVNVVNTYDVLGSVCQGFTIPQGDGLVDLNDDGIITSADSCTGLSGKCFLGRDVAHGLVVAGTVPFGQAVYDVARLSGTATQPGTNGPLAEFPSIYQASDPPIPNGAAAGGSIQFTLLKDDCTTAATGTGATNPQTKTVSGDDDYLTDAFTPDAPGDYHWKAVYSGNDPNTLGTNHNTACDQAGEDVTVQQIPTEISTAQKVYPNDSATITSSVAGDNLPEGGTVIFRLYDNATCTDADDVPGTTGLLYKQTLTGTAEVVPSGGADSVTVGTTNTTVSVDATDDYYWRVTYATGDQAHTGRQSDCVEHTDIEFNNDTGPGTVFP